MACLCLLTAPAALSDDYNASRNEIDVARVVGEIVSAQPSDREVMFINMVFVQLSKDLV